jgi:ankyrin repeat protein
MAMKSLIGLGMRARGVRQAGKTEAVECLMRHGVMCVASKNEFIERWGIAVNLEGVSPLCMAAKRGHLNVVSLLLSRLKDELNERYHCHARLPTSLASSRTPTFIHGSQ